MFKVCKNIISFKQAIRQSSWISKGDIIEAVDGKRIDDNTEISLNVRKKTINESLTMNINTYGERFEVPIRLQVRP